MRQCLKFYVGGTWVAPLGDRTLPVVNPATEAVAGHVAVGEFGDVDRAVRAACQAFVRWSLTSREERLDLLRQIVAEYRRRETDIADAIHEEMGAPRMLAHGAQVRSGLSHFEAAIKVLETYAFAEDRGLTRIVHEPIGVCGLITPWNWPMNQIACKVAPAIATGCTMILKPSEIAPFSACLLAEVIDAAGVPAGVFNLVNGDAVTGAAIAAHRKIDMVSFTGSTRAGVAIAVAAAPTVKRVAQELGGKSPVILLEGADHRKAVAAALRQLMSNSGQSCNAPTRMVVPASRMAEVIELVREQLASITVADPEDETSIGPVVSLTQWERVQHLIRKGMEEGATLVAGGPGLPDGISKGFYVRPTAFADVTSDMTIAREEIFGPVLSILGYASLDDAVEIANDSDYGLAAYVWGDASAQLLDAAARLRVGRVCINGVGGDILAPFGGYKMSGNGREWGSYGFDEFVETKAVLGFSVAP